MVHRAAIHLLPILLAVPALAETQPATPVISLAMHYSVARARLFEAGFQPYRVIPPDSDLFRKNFAGREEIARKYPEAAKCQPKDRSPCYFLFVRGQNEIVAITTMGAHPDSLHVRKVHVATAQEAEKLYGK
jgi:hypothetical protein